MAWRFYCPKCKRIVNRLQVAYGDDGVRFCWHRCRTCGAEVVSLKKAIESVLIKADIK